MLSQVSEAWEKRLASVFKDQKLNFRIVALYLFVDSAPLGLSLVDLLINFSFSLLLAHAVSPVSLGSM
jgi:hypothetical protein